MASDFNKGVIEEFRANKGKVGGQFASLPLVIVNTVGARSGEVRTVPLAYIGDGELVYVVGTGARGEDHPGWYYNLIANPDVTYERGAETIEARATLLLGDRRNAAWEAIAMSIPALADEQSRVSRELPIFSLASR